MDDPYRSPLPCDHGVAFDEAAYHALPTGLLRTSSIMLRAEVRQRWPRLNGPCPKGCGFSGIAYASSMHYLAGDW
jgi:hypothetical protein